MELSSQHFGLDRLLGVKGGARSEHRDVLRGSILLAALLWLPLAIIGLLEWMGIGPVEPLHRDLAVHARVLIAIPLLPIALAMLQQRRAEALKRIVDEEFVSEPAIVDRFARGVERWSRSSSLCATLFVLALCLGQAIFWGLVKRTTAAADAELEPISRGPANVWYTWLALPVFYYLMLRVLFEWELWTTSVLKLARLRLRTAATHPDRAGGIAFLRRPTLAFSLTVFVSSTVLSAAWGTRIAFHGAVATDYAYSLSLWVLIVLLISFGPLLLFVPLLVAAKRNGDEEYGRLAIVYSRRFHERWVSQAPGPELLGTSDIQSLSDMGGSFGFVDRMRLVPFGNEDVLLLLLSAIVPMVPLVLTQIPLTTIFDKLVHAVL